MLRLMLLRHAKSSWADAGMDDKDRPLNSRGLRAAPMVGAYMRKHKLIPDLVLCSPARRAHETWNLVAEELKASPETIIDDTLYDFGDGSRILQSIAAKAAEAKTILVVGHNPSIEQLALRLTGKSNAELREQLESKYPTGALSVIDFEVKSWDDVKDGTGLMSTFVKPRDLEDKE